MNKQKLAPLLALLLTKKFIIPAAFLLALGIIATGVAIKFTLNLQTPKVAGASVEIHPTLNLDLETLKCITTQGSLTAAISAPAADQKFTTTDTINFESSENYLCSDNPEFTYSWILDGNTEPFSTEKEKSSLKNIATGNHTVKYIVSNKNLTTTTEVKFNVIEATVYNIKCFNGCDATHLCANGLSCQGGKCVLASNPSSDSCQPARAVPPVQPTINQKPTINIISPTNNEVYESRYLDSGCSYYADIDLSGVVTDAEDGELTGRSLQWYMDGDQIGTGKGFTHTICTGYGRESVKHTITLRGTDSKGEYNEKTVPITVNYFYYDVR